jgi:hypothetical protein
MNVCCLWVAGEQLGFSSSSEGDHIKWFAVEVFHLHTGGANWHPGDGDPDHIGALGQQAFNFFYRYVSLNNIAIDDGCVA